MHFNVEPDFCHSPTAITLAASTCFSGDQFPKLLYGSDKEEHRVRKETTSPTATTVPRTHTVIVSRLMVRAVRSVVDGFVVMCRTA